VGRRESSAHGVVRAGWQDVAVPSVLTTVSRRRLLLGGAALALFGGTAVTACGTTAPVKVVDALLGQLERAQSDRELAGNAAAAAPPVVAAALTVVVAQRAAHAKALTEEITRMSGEAPATSTPSSSSTSVSAPAASSASTAPTGPPPKPPSVDDVIAALTQSAGGASQLATQQSGYRAGLLGSIAAACTAAATVALTGSGRSS
jgi:hypothetical protein